MSVFPWFAFFKEKNKNRSDLCSQIARALIHPENEYGAGSRNNGQTICAQKLLRKTRLTTVCRKQTAACLCHNKLERILFT